MQSDSAGLLGQPYVALTLPETQPIRVAYLLLPDVTPIPEGFPSSDAASVLCAVGHLKNRATRDYFVNPRTNFTRFRVSPYIGL